MAEATMAEISDQALTRHQYQRRICTKPIPALSAMRNFQAPAIELRNRLTTPAKIMMIITEMRETMT